MTMLHTTMRMVRYVLLVAALASLSSLGQAKSSHYQSYETIAQRIDDGNKVTAEKIYIKLNSDGDPEITVDKTITNSLGGDVASSKGAVGNKDTNNAIRPWLKSDWIKQLRKASKKRVHKHNLVGDTDFDASSRNSIGGHQLFAQIRPRNVESPALSVDTGHSRSMSPSDRLANGIKRLFNVEEGHYADIYERIDKHKPLKRRKPAETIDDRLSRGR